MIGEIAAEQFSKANLDNARANGVSEKDFNEQVRQIASLATAAFASASGQDGTIADITSRIAVDNNFLDHQQQMKLRDELNACASEPDPEACRSAEFAKAEKVSKANNETLLALNTACGMCQPVLIHPSLS